MVPVIILSDGYLANGAEPWKIPERRAKFPNFTVKFATEKNSPNAYLPYKRNPDTLARPWAVPGTPGLEHRIGGLEKQDVTGNINYEPLNHENMVRIRAAKVAAIAQDIPDIVPAGDPDGDLLIVAWGSTHGAITAAVKAQRARGPQDRPRASAPSESAARESGRRDQALQAGAGARNEHGPTALVLRAKYLVDADRPQQDSGPPFKQAELEQKIEELLGVTKSMATATLPPITPLTKKDFQTDQEVRWCPGCGDYAILSAVQSVFPELGIKRENFVVISGIGCSSRFPYYMNTFGFHTIHGRAPAVATGIKAIAAGPGSLGRHRRRRCALHRRQSHHSHAAPQRRPESAALQQPHLRIDQGPVFADLGTRQENQIDAVRLAGSPVQSGVAGDRRRSHVRRALRRCLPGSI